MRGISDGAVLSPSRANRAGTSIYLDKWGEERLPSFQTVDIKIDRSFTFGRVKVSPSIDAFNLLNANTVLARRLQQNSPTANNISGIVAPRVLRIGGRVTW
jgi:hypothetical protein